MKETGKPNYVFLVAAFLGLLFFTLFTYFTSGCYHNNEKIGTILLLTFSIIILIYAIGDPIQFIIMAIDRATWPPKILPYITPKNAKEHNHLDYLKLRLNTLKFELTATSNHLDEYVNVSYKLIALDLWVYSKYFIILLIMVIITRDEFLYYNSYFKHSIFMYNQTNSMGISEIRTLDQVYYYIETQLIDAFGIDDPLGSNWQHGEQNIRIGVVALRQLRRKKDTHVGWDRAEFTELDYSERWKLPFQRLPFTDKYWNIYTPWLHRIKDTPYMYPSFFPNHNGYFQTYQDLEGYLVLLARAKKNSRQILDYLRKNNWLDKYTAVLSMEFEMYSVDSHILTSCTLQIEQTPHGMLVGTADTESIILNVTGILGTWGLICYCIYVVILVDFSKPLVKILWFEHHQLLDIWHQLDLVIVILNIAIMGVLIWSESLFKHLSYRLETAHKNEFIQFKGLVLLRQWSRILIGFLVCLTTLRMWKVLQFAKVFRIMSTALYTALPTIVSTSTMCIIFTLGFSMSMVIINGNNSKSMDGFIPTIITALCNCFGFKHRDHTNSSYGETLLFIVFVLIMTFLLSNMMINVLISMINSSFMETRRNPKYNKKKISFFEFLKVEYVNWFRFYKKLPCVDKGYKRNNRTVAQNIRLKLNNLDKRYYAQRRIVGEDIDETTKHDIYKLGIERTLTLSKILNAQMGILEYMLEKNRE